MVGSGLGYPRSRRVLTTGVFLFSDDGRMTRGARAAVEEEEEGERAVPVLGGKCPSAANRT